MRKRIQRSMMLILAVTLLLFYAIMSVILYNRNLELLKREVKQEAEYICTAVNISGSGYLEKLSQVDEGTRVTQIDDSGNVLYDSSSEEEDMENHGARQEVKEALASGTGESVRMSNTLGRELYYYAVLLDNGTVLRVAKSMDNLAMTALNVFPVIGGLADQQSGINRRKMRSSGLHIKRLLQRLSAVSWISGLPSSGCLR